MFLSCNVLLTTASSWSGCPSFLKCWDVLWIWSFLVLVGSNPMLLLVVKPGGIYWYYSIIRELNKVTWPTILIPHHRSFKKYLLNNYLALLFFFFRAMTDAEGQSLGPSGRSMLDNTIGVGDMVLLESLTEDSMLENLWNRYNNKDIYVSL